MAELVSFNCLLLSLLTPRQSITSWGSEPPESRDTNRECIGCLASTLQHILRYLSERAYLNSSELNCGLDRLRVPTCTGIVVPVKHDKTVSVPVGAIRTLGDKCVHTKSP